MTDNVTNLRPPAEQRPDPIEVIVSQADLMERLSVEVGRLGIGIERIVAKYGAEHPEVANALNDLLRGRETPEPPPVDPKPPTAFNSDCGVCITSCGRCYR